MPACPRGFGSTPVPLAYFDTNFTYASTHMRQHSTATTISILRLLSATLPEQLTRFRRIHGSANVGSCLTWHPLAIIEWLAVVRSVSSRLTRCVSLRLRLSGIDSDSSSIRYVSRSSDRSLQPSNLRRGYVSTPSHDIFAINGEWT
jgi:hypothetical protein